MVCLRRCIVVAIDGASYDVDVSPYGGEKKNVEVAGNVLCRTTLSFMTSYHWNDGKTHTHAGADPGFQVRGGGGGRT